MKLIKKINRSYIVFSSVSLIAGLILIYTVMQIIISGETEEVLSMTKESVVANLKKGNEVNFVPYVEVKELTRSNYAKAETFIDTLIYNEQENEYDSFKQLKSVYRFNGKSYLITVRSDNIDPSDIMLSVGLPAFIVLFFMIILSGFFVNRINTSIWRPFYENLEVLKIFKVQDSTKLELKRSEIDEFEYLNKSIAGLTEKIKDDFNKQKEFSENTSHELQTPLAVIKAKVETLLQSNRLGNEEVGHLQSIITTLNRLVRLNNSLNLLNKIESIEYLRKSEYHLSDIVSKKIDEFHEIAETKKLAVTKNIERDISLLINGDLLDILISNLFSNAIKYNVNEGFINFRIDDDNLTIENSGPDPGKDTLKLFDRFEKGSYSSDSPGLGLTIVKRICEINNASITYTYSDNKHIVVIHWDKTG